MARHRRSDSLACSEATLQSESANLAELERDLGADQLDSQRYAQRAANIENERAALGLQSKLFSQKAVAAKSMEMRAKSMVVAATALVCYLLLVPLGVFKWGAGQKCAEESG